MPRAPKKQLDNLASILRLIRGGMDTRESLYSHFGLSLHVIRTEQFILNEHIKRLATAGIITIQHDNGGETFRISEHWLEIQNLLKISLNDLSLITGDEATIVLPYFGPPKELASPLDLFVVMPFRAELHPVYEDHITAVAQKLGLKFARGDDFFSAHSVMQDIWNAIAASKIIIGDCTGKNPNVFYEIGIAHTLGRPVILITQDPEDVPFDLRHLRYIHYELTPRGMKTFEETLAETLASELGLAST